MFEKHSKTLEYAHQLLDFKSDETHKQYCIYVWQTYQFSMAHTGNVRAHGINKYIYIIIYRHWWLKQCHITYICIKSLMSLQMWQSSRPASFSPAGLTLWPSWLERWLATLSGLSVQVRNQWGCRDITLGARPQAWVKLSALIVHSEPTDCHVSLWPGENGGLPDSGVWCHWGREECDNPAGLLAFRQRVWPFGRVG